MLRVPTTRCGRLAMAAFTALAFLAGCTPNPPPSRTFQSLTVNGGQPLRKGDTLALHAAGSFSDGTSADVSAQATWTTSDPTVASVSAGTVTAVAKGQAVITAAYMGLSGSTTITVNDPGGTLRSIIVSPAGQTLAKGTQLQLSALGIFADGTSMDVTQSAAWSVDKPDLAAIGSDGTARGLLKAQSDQDAGVVVTATLSGISGVAAENLSKAQVQSIAVSAPLQTIAMRTRVRFSATGTLTDGTSQDLSGSVTWATSDEGVASVSNEKGSAGAVKGLAAGMVTIKAYLDNGPSGMADLTVTGAKLQTLTLSPPMASVPAGLQQRFSASGAFDDQSTQDLSDQVTWSSLTPDYASISGDGLVTTKQKGMAQIQASFDDGDPAPVTGTADLNVTDALVTSVTVTSAANSVPKGLTQQFQASGLFTDGQTRDITGLVTWASADTSVAIISNTQGSIGLLTGVAAGTTTISATVPAAQSANPGGPAVGSISFTVAPPVAVSIDVSPKEQTIAAGTTLQFNASGTFSDGSHSDLTTSVEWQSSDPTVATISNTDDSRGLATAVATGTAPTTIKAVLSSQNSPNGLSGQTTLSVQ